MYPTTIDNTGRLKSALCLFGYGTSEDWPLFFCHLYTLHASQTPSIINVSFCCFRNDLYFEVETTARYLRRTPRLVNLCRLRDGYLWFNNCEKFLSCRPSGFVGFVSHKPLKCIMHSTSDKFILLLC